MPSTYKIEKQKVGQKKIATTNSSIVSANRDTSNDVLYAKGGALKG